MSLKKVLKYFKSPTSVCLALSSKGVFNWMSDSSFIKFRYYCEFGKRLNLQQPKTYNEKIQWLKLFDRNPEYTNLVDKYEVRKHVSQLIGEKYLIPLLGVYDSFDEIDFEKLPNQFVLKCTHDSGGVVICKDKEQLDIKLIRKKINRCLKKNFYYYGREWPYKNIKPRIICEKYMVDESGIELKDYKFFCFNGVPKALFIATDRGIDTRFDFFDMNFNHLPFMQHYKNAVKEIDKPTGFDEMVRLSAILSNNIPHVRVDFYDINGRVYFGELTFYHFSGFEKFEPDEYDSIFGSWLELQQG